MFENSRAHFSRVNRLLSTLIFYGQLFGKEKYIIHVCSKQIASDVDFVLVVAPLPISVIVNEVVDVLRCWTFDLLDQSTD